MAGWHNGDAAATTLKGGLLVAAEHAKELKVRLDEQRAESEVGRQFGRVRSIEMQLDRQDARCIQEERQRRSPSCRSAQLMGALTQPPVVCLFVGRAAGYVLLITPPPAIASVTAVRPIPCAAIVREAMVLFIIEAGMLRGLKRNAFGLSELANAHTGRHEQRPTGQEENHHSGQTVTHSDSLNRTNHFNIHSVSICVDLKGIQHSGWAALGNRTGTMGSRMEFVFAPSGYVS